MKNVHIIILTLSCLTNIVLAQGSNREASFQNADPWGKFIAKPLHDAARSNNAFSLCASGVTFSKFIVKADGEIGNIAFTVNAPAEIKALLRDVINSTQGHWNIKIVNGIAMDSQPILLPLYFSLEARCGNNSLQSQEKYGQGIKDMLNFDDGSKFSQLDCTLLQPLELFSQR